MITQANRPEARSATDKRIVVCDECGREISDPDDVRLLRPAHVLPEDSALYEVHADCRTDFMANHDGRWNEYDLMSAEAGWLLSVTGDGE